MLRSDRPGRWLVAVAGLCLITALACSGKAADEADADVVVSVKTATVGREPIVGTTTAVGTVYAKREAVVGAPVSGTLGDLGRIQNQPVRAGQVLAVLAAVDFYTAQKDLRQAQASVSALEALATRRRALYEKGGISKKDLDDTELELANAQADLRASQSTVGMMSGAQAGGKASVRAPFDGVISEQMQFDGEFVAQGAPLFRVSDLSELIVKARFADTVAALIAQDSVATVEDEAFGGQTVQGTVILVSMTSDPESRTMEVWVRVPDAGGKLRAGDAARVTAIIHQDPNALVVPAPAVQLDASNGDDGKVMVVDAEGVAHEKAVKVGIRTADRVQIVDGLTGGETVVTEGNYALPDKTKVKVEGDEKPDTDAKPFDGNAAADGKP